LEEYEMPGFFDVNEIKRILNISSVSERETLITELSSKFDDGNSLIAELRNKNILLETARNNISNELANRNNEIISLQNQLNEKIKLLAQEGGAGKDFISDFEIISLKYEAVKKESIVKDTELINKHADLKRISVENESLRSELNFLNSEYLRSQQEKNLKEKELGALKSKLKATFTPEQMSQYFSNAIDKFNNQLNTSIPSLNYVIGEMDVELKTNITKDDSNDMVMSAPDITNENNLSTIKFSIRAVPKGIAPK
jgi:chromosome segregation ATPase